MTDLTALLGDDLGRHLNAAEELYTDLYAHPELSLAEHRAAARATDVLWGR